MNPKDPLESFLQNQRHLLDTERPDPKLWDRIASQLPKEPARKRRRPWKIIVYAAAACLLITIGLALGIVMADHQEPPLWSQNLAYQDFVAFEAMSIKRIDTRLQQLRQMEADSTLEEDLKEIDQSLWELKNEINHLPEGQQKMILYRLKQGYQLKLETLDQIISNLENLPAKKNYHDYTL